MAIPKIGRPKVLDGREIFYLYYTKMEKGASLDKVSKNLFKQGIFNQTLGKPYSGSAVFQSMWNWALFNLEEALPILKEYDTKWGLYRTEEEWKDTILNRAHSYLTKGLLAKFYEKYPNYK